MTLRNYLIANGLASADPAAVVARLAETVELSRNSERWYLTGIGKLIGRDALLQLLAGLEAVPQLKPMLYVLQAGVFLDDTETRESIQGVAAAGLMTAETAATLLNAGIQYGAVWQRAGLDALPDKAAVTEAQATIATEQLREQVAVRYQAVRAAIDAGEILTVEAAVAKFSEVA